MADTSDIRQVYDDMAEAIAESHVFPFPAIVMLNNKPPQTGLVLVLGVYGFGYVGVYNKTIITFRPEDIVEVG